MIITTIQIMSAILLSFLFLANNRFNILNSKSSSVLQWIHKPELSGSSCPSTSHIQFLSPLGGGSTGNSTGRVLWILTVFYNYLYLFFFSHIFLNYVSFLCLNNMGKKFYYLINILNSKPSSVQIDSTISIFTPVLLPFSI